MPLEDFHIKQLVIDLLNKPSARDKQKLIGASEIGNPCAYCLANRLLAKEGGLGGNRYWMGARIGTAIHKALETEAETADVTDYRYAILDGAIQETSIVLGTIEGYGTVKSKPDLVLTKDRHLVDYKTSTATKIKHYKLDGVPQQYVYQQQLYAWGLNQADTPIERISLAFIQRDGLTDNDIWVHSFDYNESVALHAWNRLKGIWEWLQDGNDPENLPSDPSCYVCSRVLYRV